MNDLVVNNPKDLIWSQKYRPTTVQDCILPNRLKAIFQGFVDDGEIPSAIFIGGPGVGKTTLAVAMCNELGVDYIIVNSSMDGDIGTLRNDIQNFASTISFTGGRKMVILDECDSLRQPVQDALRNFSETFSTNCGFIGTGNYKQKISEALKSRMPIIEFNITKKEMAELGPQLIKRIEQILKAEDVEYDKKVVMALVAKKFPDIRKILNELQQYAASGKIDSGILADIEDETFKVLIEHMKAKSFSKCRNWIGEHEDISAADFYRKFFDQSNDYFKPESVPQLILYLGKYQYQEAFVADTQINRAAFVIECMADCEFK